MVDIAKHIPQTLEVWMRKNQLGIPPENTEVMEMKGPRKSTNIASNMLVLEN